MSECEYKGVVFDLDGTLANSLEDLIDSCNAMLTHFGYPTHDYETGKTFIGNGIRNLVIKALPENVRDDDAIVDAALEKMNAEYAARYKDKTKPYDGVPAMLQWFVDQGIPFGVNTNKPDYMAQIVIETLFGKEHFTSVFGQRDDRPRKPDPTQALILAEQFDAKPEECLYVGDSLVDYETAVNAGMTPVLCSWGFAKKEKLFACEKATVVDHPSQVIEAAKVEK